MHLKNLTVLGFKSFADKTVLNFQPGITAVVGPNGCGKSNVADAIRWVLGEQSAKALRGGEMADVIFNGTDGRKPLGMAEVSLTIGNVDEEHLRAAGVEVAFNEVTLTRRVYRDGGSEYFINKTACRLKDIQQLFMGTGVGRTSYSIMAQGNITQILSSKPEDRRMVFEEAAGITKFRAQKKESLRKLESTEQNLLRVADTIKEVKRQIGSLQRQAGKARRFKQLAQDLQHLETQLARHQYDVLQAEISDRTERVSRLQSEISASTQAVETNEMEIALQREALAELEQQIAAAQQRGLELRAEMERHESRVHYNEERCREVDSQHGRAIAEITECEQRQTLTTHELESVNERLAAAVTNLEQQRQTLTERRGVVEANEREMIRVQNELRQTQNQSLSTAQQLARMRNEINSLDLQKQGNQVRLEKLESERIQLEEEITGLTARLADFAQSVEADKASAQSQRGTVEERQQRLRAIQQELNQTGQELDKLLRLQAEKHSRLNVLEQLQESHEGFSAGALAALKQSESVLGSLIDRIQVPDRLVVAVESALGANLQLILTQQPGAAQKVLAGLAEKKAGRANIAALDFTNLVATLAVQEPIVTPEGAECVLDSVQASEDVRPLLQALLGRTLVVQDLDAAIRGWQECQGRNDFVALDGQLLSRSGVFTGGHLNGNGSGKAPASILGRKNQIAELQQQLATVHEEVSEASRKKGALQSEQTALQASLQEAQTELRAREVAIATRQGEFNALQRSLHNLRQRIETVRFEASQLQSHENEGMQKRNALADQAAQLESREKGLLAQIAEGNTQLEQIRQQRDSAHANLTEIKVQLASEEQVVASLRRQQQPLEQRLRELAQSLAARKNDIGSFLSRRTQAEQEIASSRERIQALQLEREQVSEETAGLVGKRDDHQTRIVSSEESLRETRVRLGAFQQERSNLEVELAQKQMASQNLCEKIQQKYQLKLEEVRSECITITIADEGPAKVQTLTPEEMAAHGAATDWKAVAEQVAALQKRLDEIGPVNLVAIEEYEETEQRFQFLSTQHDDLVKAKEQLMEVLNKINTQTREMFVATFNQIRDNFRAMFSEVFGGGKADLILRDEGDVLESGIDIVARPPGKQLQSITLLSGGEQTMTAVSLLFSIYQVKPSPFCVLDELDAPLDESNINRFIRVLQRFLVHSQFIIITHNKRTIGMADVLYGVTMQEHGVSRIVSVKFHKQDEAVTDHAPKPLVPRPDVAPLDSEEDAQVKKDEAIEIVMAK